MFDLTFVREILIAYNDNVNDINTKVMKLEMEIVQNMEAADDRDSEAYANDLDNLLAMKKESVDLLSAELKRFQAFRRHNK